MILQALVDYYEALAQRGEISPQGWCTERASFALNLSPAGELVGVIPQVHMESRGKKEVEVPDQMQVPERYVRSSGIRANFLCDNATYLLGYDSKGKPEKALEYFKAAKQLHLEVLKDCQGEAAQAVKNFFNTWNPRQSNENPLLQPYQQALATANLVFLVNGETYAQKDTEIRDAWWDYRNQNGNAAQSLCLVCGKELPLAELHGKIKGVPGAQSAGASLISFNASAYESYGQGSGGFPNAPISEYAAFAYVTALNHLLADRDHRRQIGDTMVVYWAEQADPKPRELFELFAFPEPDSDSALNGVMQNLALGKPIDDVDMSRRFYVLGLAPNAARISVRFFLQDSFGHMLDNLRLHYERLEIQKPAFDNRQYLSIPQLLWETVNPKSKDKASSPLLSGAVMRSVITGTPYPQSLYGAVMTRIRADRNLSRGRVAIIKAYLIRNQNGNEVITMALNEGFHDRAYVLGRLFAVLEDAQLQANPGINTTIKDRYFTSACATPGIVFPQLLRLSANHTAKAQYGYAREKEKAQLIDLLNMEEDPLPTHLSLKEQGMFMLGYYHQVQARYKKKEETDNGSNQ